MLNLLFYLKDRAKTTKKYFLETADGQPYVIVFKKLRLNHLVNHHMDMEMLLTGILYSVTIHYYITYAVLIDYFV